MASWVISAWQPPLMIDFPAGQVATSVLAPPTDVTGPFWPVLIPPYCGIFSWPVAAEYEAAPLVPTVVSKKGAAKAPVPFKNVVTVPDEVPRRAAGMVPVF